MTIGIAGSNPEAARAIKRIIRQRLKEAQVEIKEYLPAEVVLDIEERIFNCNIMILNVSADEEDKRAMIRLGGQIHQEMPACQLIFIVDGVGTTTEFYEVQHCYLIHRKQTEMYIEQALSKAMEGIAEQSDVPILEMISGGRKVYIRASEILYIERQGRASCVMTRERSYTTYESLNNIVKQVKAPLFRCHASYIVNLEMIKNMSADWIELNGDWQVPLGRTYAAGIRQEIRRRWREEKAGENQS